MSIMNKWFSKGLLWLFFAHLLTAAVYSQRLKINIEVRPEKPGLLTIRGEFSEEPVEKDLLFLLSRADSGNLAARIGNLNLFDARGQSIGHRKIAEGAFAAERPFSAFVYQMETALPANVLSTAHISWIAGQKGVLRLNDLLPRFEAFYPTEVSLALPAGWETASSEKISAGRSFSVKNPENAFFIVGRGWNDLRFKVSRSNVTLIVDEKWNIDRSFLERSVREILLKYESYFGLIPQTDLLLVNFGFPADVGFDRWRAESFGGNVLIMTAPPVFESRLRQRMLEQFRHELFHLWMPNNLALEGDFAWFYEGFAQYSALKAGLALNHITFSDFLQTLEQAVDLAGRRSQPLSLIEASKSRWTGENSSVYAKGLAVAFLFDAALIKQSGGRRDLISMLGEIYEKFKKPGRAEDGNRALLEIINRNGALSAIAADYVTGEKKLDFEKHLEQTGIEISTGRTGVRFRVKEKLTGREKDFLDKLGYNNWRKNLKR